MVGGEVVYVCGGGGGDSFSFLTLLHPHPQRAFQTREPLAGAVLAGACRRGVRSESNVPHVMKFETILQL
jgi:hypothetical protein